MPPSLSPYASASHEASRQRPARFFFPLASGNWSLVSVDLAASKLDTSIKKLGAKASRFFFVNVLNLLWLLFFLIVPVACYRSAFFGRESWPFRPHALLKPSHMMFCFIRLSVSITIVREIFLFGAVWVGAFYVEGSNIWSRDWAVKIRSSQISSVSDDASAACASTHAGASLNLALTILKKT